MVSLGNRATKMQETPVALRERKFRITLPQRLLTLQTDSKPSDSTRRGLGGGGAPPVTRNVTHTVFLKDTQYYQLRGHLP